MRDLKYNFGTITSFLEVNYNLPKAVNSPEVKDVAEQFVTNFSRGNLLLRLPEVFTRMCACSAAETVDASRPDANPESVAQFRTPDIGYKSVEILVNLPNVPETGRALEFLITSVLLNAWLSFEVLAADLWINAVNSRPMSLGEKALLAPGQSKEKERMVLASDVPDDTLEEAVRMDILKEHGFDLSAYPKNRAAR